MIRIIDSSDTRAVNRVFARRAVRLEDAERTVQPVIEAVHRAGDAALVRYARQWDRYAGKTAAGFAVSADDIAAAAREVSPAFRRAVTQAARNIRTFARLQMPREWRKQLAPGIRAGQLIRPLDSVGCYIPAGRYPLPSTLLMTAIPAQVAGVPRIVVCTPKLVPEILAVAHELGITELYTVGGAQAIAALAYGTKTIARVAKIVGPGNAYVAAAKRLVSRDVSIDFVAGPTEVLIIAEGREANSEFIAADMLAQAEHDVDAAAIVLVDSRRLAERIARALAAQLATLPKGTPATESLRNNGAIIVIKNRDEAIRLANRFAPEHLCVPVGFPLRAIQNAGSIFVGPYSPEAAGDYASGPNHVLPTSGMARLRGGLSVLDYLKVVTVQQLDRAGLARITPTITTIARSEGLEAHARSVEIRMKTSSITRKK
ncbi:MAG: histidinol dehydrogenase [Acidobacteria bacterium]|nr:histidinol dehydrogenase [Acidobacteriota bacterium]